MFLKQFILKNLIHILAVTVSKCSIDGLSYMDPNTRRPVASLYPRGQDPCNPLYWYPTHIPEYCSYKNLPSLPQKVPPAPTPLPLPVPIPQPNFLMPIPSLPAFLPGLVAVPNGIPINPINPLPPISFQTYPYASYPYGNNPPQIGMVPGLPGLVSKDGGINILPFSDVYSDIIENHKNRMIRRKLVKLIQDYEDFPNGRSYSQLRRYARENM